MTGNDHGKVIHVIRVAYRSRGAGSPDALGDLGEELGRGRVVGERGRGLNDIGGVPTGDAPEHEGPQH